MGPRVLVVDDHAGFRHQARLLLSEAGYDVVGEAASAATALQAARRLRPDVVLLDIQLPDRDGFAVAELLATEPEPPAVVLISGRDADQYGDRIDRSGARGFLAKADLSGDALGASLGGEERP